MQDERGSLEALGRLGLEGFWSLEAEAFFGRGGCNDFSGLRHNWGLGPALSVRLGLGQRLADGLFGVDSSRMNPSAFQAGEKRQCAYGFRVLSNPKNT